MAEITSAGSNESECRVDRPACEPIWSVSDYDARMPPATTVTLRVVNPYPRDVSEGHCRLHPETMSELDLEAGDVVEIAHDLGTVGAYVEPADDDWKPSPDVAREVVGIRLGNRLPGPSSNFTGERVSVRKVVPEPATEVVYEEPTGRAATEIVTRENFVGALASAGTRMAVYERRGSEVQGFLLRVFETDPDGLVVVTGATRLEERP